MFFWKERAAKAPFSGGEAILVHRRAPAVDALSNGVGVLLVDAMRAAPLYDDRFYFAIRIEDVDKELLSPAQREKALDEVDELALAIRGEVVVVTYVSFVTPWDEDSCEPFTRYIGVGTTRKPDAATVQKGVLRGVVREADRIPERMNKPLSYERLQLNIGKVLTHRRFGSAKIALFFDIRKNRR